MTEKGYEIGRERGLTAREREVLAGLIEGDRPSDIARRIGLSRQRVGQLLTALEKKGVLTRGEGGVVIRLAAGNS